MDRQQFSLSYGGDNDVGDYLYNFPADYYELYDDQLEDENQYYQSNVNAETHDEPSFWSNLTFHQLCTQCVVPAVGSTGNLLGTTLILCMFFRLFIVICNKIKIVPEAILHTVCAICGVLPLIIFHEDGDVYQLLLQIILECFTNDSKWQKTKSAHMLMSMKAMAILFDIQSNKLQMFPSVPQYTGYMMCAGTVYLGPFLTFQEYSNAFSLSVNWNKTKICHLIWKIIISLLCFVLSICVVDWLFSQHLSTNNKSNSIINIFLTMYKQALEFRTGHYFVAYASTVFATVCGYHSEYNSEILVTRPLIMEWPRSLLHVVVHWNAPMHFWLKKYVFEEVLKYGNKNKKHRNRFIAVGTTYLVSSLLHGLERRLSAVLLSLAAYTYVEHQIRTKLASRFPNKFSYYTKNKDPHHNSKTYLAYLGSIVDMSVDNSYNTTYQESFAPWSRVSYFSHCITLIMFFISIIL
ncbi:protein-serine O-palmitoleoyltransferase porcupine [Aphis craccivora]|uniref:Protein-serine O-palmitoleoyltransferase porcupine n=1 Tax=Aphis craccivora TaxID=307492 RepID=A0A6G0YBU1_APHCR|nr:protein-serine O-palmitoleoyltransferase porcupine [Aphis craccivora]